MGFDRQKAFKKAATHLLQQWARASDSDAPGSGCYYRHPSTWLKCAVGALIPDSKYTDGLEGGISSAVLDAVGAGFDDVGFLVSLQLIHDRSVVEDWPVQLGEFAVKWDLDTSGIPGL